ncbi:hypothetical protein [Pseudomonas sp. Irchel 3A7]|uniref:hypothetical protein n=1 Tax=Pseudomonas sp. Irchel 3A7 TaxID=2008913 RepID=UPI000BA42336|nr:hypothetical protein [Pseudomonas sp. Irchel 3A7]
MSVSQKIITSLFAIANNERFGFYVAEECRLIEKIVEVADLPFDEDTYRQVKAKLPTLLPALKEIGVEITHPRMGYYTVWAPGVKRG